MSQMRARQGGHKSSINVNSLIISSQQRTIAVHCQVDKRDMFGIAPKTPHFPRLSKHRNCRSRCFTHIRPLDHSRFSIVLAYTLATRLQFLNVSNSYCRQNLKPREPTQQELNYLHWELQIYMLKWPHHVHPPDTKLLWLCHSSVHKNLSSVVLVNGHSCCA